MITMEKIDYVISVTGAEYIVVRDALLASDGDVDRAVRLIMGEEKKEESFEEKADFDFKNAKKTTFLDKKVSFKKMYYYKVRAYKTVKGKKIYGAYSVVKKVKCK